MPKRELSNPYASQKDSNTDAKINPEGMIVFLQESFTHCTIRFLIPIDAELINFEDNLSE